MSIALHDTLVCDTVLLNRFKEDGAYGYGRELRIDEQGLMERLLDELRRFFSALGRNFEGEGDNIAMILAIVAIVVVIMLVVYKRPQLFRKSGRDNMQYDATQDNIYGVDFEAEIKSAIEKELCNEAVRLLFLKTLRWLADNGRIQWQIYKTPTQYVNEVGDRDFNQLTNLFMRVRYGNHIADMSMVEAAARLQQRITKQGEGGV